MKTSLSLLLLLAVVGSVFSQDQDATLEQVVQQLENKITEQKQQLDAWQASHARLTSDVKQLQADVEQKDAQIAALQQQAQVDNMEIQRKDAQVTALKQELDATQILTQDVQQKDAEISRLNQQLLDVKVDATKTAAQGMQQKDAEISQLKKQAETSRKAFEAQIAQLKATEDALREQAKADCVDGMQQLQKDYAAQISDLQEQLQRAPSQTADLGAMFSTLARSVTTQSTAAVERLKVIAMELQQGNTTQLNLLAQQTYTAVIEATRAGHACVLKEVDEHLPFVKQYATEAWAKCEALYEKHIGSATWAAEINKHLSTANVELKAAVTKVIKSHPALSSLDDPVYIQLIAYSVIGAPVVLLFLPVLLWFAALCTPASKDASAAAKGAKKTKKKPSKPAGPKPKA